MHNDTHISALYNTEVQARHRVLRKLGDIAQSKHLNDSTVTEKYYMKGSPTERMDAQNSAMSSTVHSSSSTPIATSTNHLDKLRLSRLASPTDHRSVSIDTSRASLQSSIRSVQSAMSSVRHIEQHVISDMRHGAIRSRGTPTGSSGVNTSRNTTRYFQSMTSDTPGDSQLISTTTNMLSVYYSSTASLRSRNSSIKPNLSMSARFNRTPRNIHHTFSNQKHDTPQRKNIPACTGHKHGAALPIPSQQDKPDKPKKSNLYNGIIESPSYDSKSLSTDNAFQPSDMLNKPKSRQEAQPAYALRNIVHSELSLPDTAVLQSNRYAHIGRPAEVHISDNRSNNRTNLLTNERSFHRERESIRVGSPASVSPSHIDTSSKQNRMMLNELLIPNKQTSNQIMHSHEHNSATAMHPALSKSNLPSTFDLSLTSTKSTKIQGPDGVLQPHQKHLTTNLKLSTPERQQTPNLDLSTPERQKITNTLEDVNNNTNTMRHFEHGGTPNSPVRQTTRQFNEYRAEERFLAVVSAWRNISQINQPNKALNIPETKQSENVVNQIHANTFSIENHAINSSLNDDPVIRNTSNTKHLDQWQRHSEGINSKLSGSALSASTFTLPAHAEDTFSDLSFKFQANARQDLNHAHDTTHAEFKYGNNSIVPENDTTHVKFKYGNNSIASENDTAHAEFKYDNTFITPENDTAHTGFKHGNNSIASENDTTHAEFKHDSNSTLPENDISSPPPPPPPRPTQVLKQTKTLDSIPHLYPSNVKYEQERCMSEDESMPAQYESSSVNIRKQTSDRSHTDQVCTAAPVPNTSMANTDRLVARTAQTVDKHTETSDTLRNKESESLSSSVIAVDLADLGLPEQSLKRVQRKKSIRQPSSKSRPSSRRSVAFLSSAQTISSRLKTKQNLSTEAIKQTHKHDHMQEHGKAKDQAIPRRSKTTRKSMKTYHNPSSLMKAQLKDDISHLNDFSDGTARQQEFHLNGTLQTESDTLDQHNYNIHLQNSKVTRDPYITHFESNDETVMDNLSDISRTDSLHATDLKS